MCGVVCRIRDGIFHCEGSSELPRSFSRLRCQNHCAARSLKLSGSSVALTPTCLRSQRPRTSGAGIECTLEMDIFSGRPIFGARRNLFCLVFHAFRTGRRRGILHPDCATASPAVIAELRKSSRVKREEIARGQRRRRAASQLFVQRSRRLRFDLLAEPYQALTALAGRRRATTKSTSMLDPGHRLPCRRPARNSSPPGKRERI